MGELDFKYTQYTQGNMPNENAGSGAVKPYQEVIDYFENNKSNFHFDDFKNNITGVNGVVELVLSDGSKIVVEKHPELLKVAIEYADGNKYIGAWTNIADGKEFLKSLEP